MVFNFNYRTSNYFYDFLRKNIIIHNLINNKVYQNFSISK
jgi:hypothetical protein